MNQVERDEMIEIIIGEAERTNIKSINAIFNLDTARNGLH